MEFLSFHLRFECQRWKKYFHFLCCRSHVSKEKRLLVCCGCCRCYSLNVIYWNKSALSHSSRHVIIIILLLLYYLNGVSISMLEQKLARLAQLNWVECGNETRQAGWQAGKHKEVKSINSSSISNVNIESNIAKKHIVTAKLRLKRTNTSDPTIERRTREFHCPPLVPFECTLYSPKCVELLAYDAEREQEEGKSEQEKIKWKAFCMCVRLRYYYETRMGIKLEVQVNFNLSFNLARCFSFCAFFANDILLVRSKCQKQLECNIRLYLQRTE